MLAMAMDQLPRAVLTAIRLRDAKVDRGHGPCTGKPHVPVLEFHRAGEISVDVCREHLGGHAPGGEVRAGPAVARSNVFPAALVSAGAAKERDILRVRAELLPRCRITRLAVTNC